VSRRKSVYFVLVAPILFGCVVASPGTRPGRHDGNGQRWELSKRPDAPQLKRIRKDRYRVSKPWTVELRGDRWQVQKGYVCNGITAPEKIRKLLGEGVDAPETWAAVFHDWLFTQPGMTRARADRLFYELLLAYGVPPLKARLFYSSVSAYSASKALD
jgi:hypothetical protein